MPESIDAMQKAAFYRSLLKIIQDWEEENRVWITGVTYSKTATVQEMSVELNFKTSEIK